ncbi:ankyrin repeat-containing domain protein [Cadophora sp. MPI-SDFR-AT-0126]|nr:ankyrin repeat-containing domain protein [Leotiomycetes sp. MPI-SDFR-AT-0126]
MDPMSIVASSIAIVQAADRIGGLLGKLKPLFEAPREVEQLIKDVASLKSLINDVSGAAKEMNRSGILPAEKLETLKDFVDEAGDILNELDRLIESFKKPPKGIEGRLEVHRGTWTRKVGEVEKLRSRMRELRLSVAISLATLHIFAVVRTSQSIDQITFQAGRLLTEHSSTQRFLLKEFPEHRNMLAKLLDNQQAASIESFSHLEETKPDVGAVAVYADPAITLQNLRLKIESRYACDQHCLCACHIPYQAGYSTKWTGSLRVRISGLPYVTGSCNQDTCKKRSKARLQVQLGFPQWILGRVLTASLFCDSFTQPKYNFRTLRVRHSGDLIFIYTQTGNLTGIQKLFAEGRASVLDVDETNQSALYFAITNRQYPITEFLLEQGSDVFLEDIYGQTPFLVAWEDCTAPQGRHSGRHWIPKLFPPDFDDEMCNRRMSKLHLLISEQIQGDVFGEIEQSRNDIDYQDSLGNTALSWALQCGKTDVVKILLLNGADPALPNFEGLTPLHVAAIFDHDSIPLLLKSGASHDVRDKNGQTPLHAAARQNCRDPGPCMSPLLEAGADINAQDCYGRTPLRRACMKADQDAIIEYLTQRGANVNLTNFDGLSPIHSAIQWEHDSYIETLLKAGADCCIITADGSNILHQVAYWGSMETMQILIKWRRRLRGLDVNLKDRNGDTPLHCVSYREEEVSGEWAETFEKLINAILDVQDGVADESEETDSEECSTTDDDEDSQDDLEEDDSRDRFEDALEAQDEVAEGECS